jgi:hypothetical protein
MNCAQIRPLLSFLVERESSPYETLEARRHLADCTRCRARADRMARVMERCDAMPVAAPTADIATGVMARLRLMRDAAAQSGRDASLFNAARWSSLAVILCTFAGAMSQTGGSLLRAAASPFSWLFNLLSNADRVEAVRETAGAMAPVALRALDGGLRLEVAGPGSGNIMTSLQILGTALGLGTLIAIPVAALAAWMIHRDNVGRG